MEHLFEATKRYQCQVEFSGGARRVATRRLINEVAASIDRLRRLGNFRSRRERAPPSKFSKRVRTIDGVGSVRFGSFEGRPSPCRLISFRCLLYAFPLNCLSKLSIYFHDRPCGLRLRKRFRRVRTPNSQPTSSLPVRGRGPTRTVSRLRSQPWEARAVRSRICQI